jgi:hypothetical protein
VLSPPEVEQRVAQRPRGRQDGGKSLAALLAHQRIGILAGGQGGDADRAVRRQSGQGGLGGPHGGPRARGIAIET